ncbi:MAG TPA: outer membrane protein assembly factor, partial [Sphingomicrobium sp.]
MRLLCAAALIAGPAAPALAQTAGEPELDPSAPLDALPDLGVDWPDPGSEPQAPATAEPDEVAAEPAPAVPAGGSEIVYRVAIEGLEQIGEAAELAA